MALHAPAYTRSIRRRVPAAARSLNAIQIFRAAGAKPRVSILEVVATVSRPQGAA